MVGAHRDAGVAKLVAGLVERLFRERDVRARFRRTMRDPQKIGDRYQGVDPGVKAKLAAGLARHVADRREQCGPVEHGFGSQNPVVLRMGRAKERKLRKRRM